MSREHHVVVKPLPVWMDKGRFLGAGQWLFTEEDDGIHCTATLPTHEAADIAARLRNMGLNGFPLQVEVTPPLKRNVVRAARTDDAKRRRDSTLGFENRDAKTHPDGRIGLTPEVLALEMAKGTKGLTVFDACCGIGGNTIGFARHGATVFSVELRADLLDLARHNAIAFGVRAQITFKKGDTLSQKPQKTDICFVDPPWGVDWNKTRCTLDSFPIASSLWETFLKNPHWGSFWLKAPSSFDPRTMGVTGQVTPIFGAATGDTQRIKFLLIKVSRANLDALPH